MPLRTLAPGLHVVDLPFSIGGMSLGTRTTVVELEPRKLLVHNPGPMDDADYEAIRAHGEVAAIVAPNAMHHLFAPKAKEAFPKAKLFGGAFLASKVPSLGVEVTLEGSPWEGVFDAVFADGAPKLSETVFIHSPSKTLVVTDVAFNVRGPKGLWTKLCMKLTDGWERFGPTRLLASTVKDKAAFRASIDAVLERDFDRVIVSHGDVLDTGGKAALRAGVDHRFPPS
jgi:hypothetical protein